MPRRNAVPAADPAAAMNAQILRDRQVREDARVRRQEARNTVPDLGLNIQPQESEADNATEFLRDEFDKRNFGEVLPTTRRVVYGPDPLITNCPELNQRLQKMGREDYAAATAEAIRTKGEMALADPILRRGLKAAIARFGKEAVAQAFSDRILKIPVREYEVEVDRDIDEMLGKPLDEAVQRYCPPGMSPKFLSARCIEVLGHRGYKLVMDDRGDPVKVGTLFMGIIPTETAERRRLHWAEESERAVQEQEDEYREKQISMLAQAANLGVSLGGTRPLQRDEMLTAEASANDERALGETRANGIHFSH